MRISLLALLMLLAGAAAAKPWWLRGAATNDDGFLDPNVAFRVSAGVDGNAIRVRWVIADGYYIYRQKIAIQPESPDLMLSAPQLPPGVPKVDPYLGSQEIYQQQIEAIVPYSRTDAGAHPLQIKVTYQGCAEAGLCYPPITKVLYPAHPLAGASGAATPVGAASAPHPWVGAAILGGAFAFLWAGLVLRKGRKLELPRRMTMQPLRLAAAALLVMVGIWAGAWVYLHHRAAPAAAGIPVPAGHASAPNPSDLGSPIDHPSAGAMPSAKIPERLPQFSLSDRSGKATSIGTFAGKSLVINFWATWCAPCRSEIPLLQALHTEWAGRDVSVVGIAVDYRDKVVEYADKLKIGYPLLIGEQDALDVAATFGVDSPVFPFTVFTDRRGEVVALFIGELHRPQAELILREVQNLDTGRIQLTAARRAITDGLQALKSG